MTADRTLDIRNDDIDSRNSHAIQLEIVRREPVVWNDDVCILLCRFDIFLKSGLGLVLVSLEELGQRYLLVGLQLCILEHASG